MSGMDEFKQWLGKVGDCLLHKPTGQAPTLSKGAQAEQIAARFLQKKGLCILDRNFRCKGGEIDLIAEDHGTVAFIEVRLRSHAGFGGAAASITSAKQQRILRAAGFWFKTKGRTYLTCPCRFDALLLDTLAEMHCEWIQDAFRERSG